MIIMVPANCDIEALLGFFMLDVIQFLDPTWDDTAESCEEIGWESSGMFLVKTSIMQNMK